MFSTFFFRRSILTLQPCVYANRKNDRILDPQHPNAKPSPLSPQLDQLSSHKLSDAAYAGIGVAAGVALLAIISFLIFLMYRRKDRKIMHVSKHKRYVNEEEMAKIPPAVVEMEAKHGRTEMGLQSPIYEIGLGK